MKLKNVVIYNTTLLGNKYQPVLYLEDTNINKKDNMVILKANINLDFRFAEKDIECVLSQFINNIYFFELNYALFVPSETVKIKINNIISLGIQKTYDERLIVSIEIIGEIIE